MKWFKDLSPNQRLMIKTYCEDICGIAWVSLGLLFTPRERLRLIRNKLILEGLISECPTHPKPDTNDE